MRETSRGSLSQFYKDADRSLKLIYKPKEEGFVQFTGWVDRENFTFKDEEKQYNYNVSDQKLISL